MFQKESPTESWISIQGHIFQQWKKPVALEVSA
jgi:hypothetical protein